MSQWNIAWPWAISLIIFGLFHNGDAVIQLNITRKIPTQQMVTGTCIAYGKQYKFVAPKIIRIALVHKSRPCTLEWKPNIEQLSNSLYRNNFSIVCTEQHTIEIRCHTMVPNEHHKVQVKIVTPESAATLPTEEPQTQTDHNRPLNATIVRAGQPVTLRCETSNHTWAGWFYHDSKIQKRDTSYSISTSPNFHLPNGTVSFLTVHSVRVPGKYSCQVYTMDGNEFRDRVDFRVNVKEDILTDKNPSNTFFDILNRLFGY